MGAGSGAVSSIAGGIMGYGQAEAQKQGAEYNAQVLHQQGIAATNVAAANEAASLRKSAGELGEQAAAFGQANIGTGATVQAVEKQSATNARLDALNIWYGGTLERRQAFAQEEGQKYAADIYETQAKNALIGGAIGAGTSAVTGAGQAYAYGKTGQII